MTNKEKDAMPGRVRIRLPLDRTIVREARQLNIDLDVACSVAIAAAVAEAKLGT